VLDAYFGQERGCGGEDGGEQRPGDPGHGFSLVLRRVGVSGKKRRHER
jgi:hypothetical protein